MRWIYLSHCKNDHLAFLCRGVKWYLKKFMSLLICWYYFNHIFPYSVCTVSSACYVAVFASKDEMYVQKMLWKIPERSSFNYLSQEFICFASLITLGILNLLLIHDSSAMFFVFQNLITETVRFEYTQGIRRNHAQCPILIATRPNGQVGNIPAWNCADNIPFWEK